MGLYDEHCPGQSARMCRSCERLNTPTWYNPWALEDEQSACNMGQCACPISPHALMIMHPALYTPLLPLLCGPTCDDGHGVHLLVDQLLGLPQQLARQHYDGCSAVAHLVVLHLGDVCVRT